MKTKREALWIRWKDPIRKLVDEFDDEEDDEDDGFVSAKAFDRSQGNGNFGPCIIGAMGIIPLHEANSPSTLYNLFLLHVNFPWTKRDLTNIKDTNGVESLDVFTPYRARIGIGKAFTQAKVMYDVECALKANVPPTSTNVIAITKGMLQKAFKFWSVQIDKEGKTSIFGGESHKEVNAKMCRDKSLRRTHVSW